MATVPYSGVPEEKPQTSAPDDYQRVQANPDAFGAGIARGVQQVGQGLEQASSNVFDISKFRGQVNVDHAGNQWHDFKDKLAFGDPDKSTIGPDGKPVPDLGFMGLQGRDAADARPGAVKALRDKQSEIRETLPSPAEKLAFDNQTKRAINETEQHFGQHSEQQWRTWAGGVNGSGADLAMNGFLRNLDNDEEMKHYTADFVNFKVQQAQIKYGNDPTVIAAVVQDAHRDLLKAQLEAISVHNPKFAADLLEKPENKATAGPIYQQLADHLRARASDQRSREAATFYTGAALSGGVTSAPQVAGNFRPEVNDAISKAAAAHGLDPAMMHQFAKIESGGNPNNDTGSYRGLFQLSTKEFYKYAPPGADIHDPYANAMAAGAKLKQESSEFQAKYGRAPTTADLYLIHQQGAGGYANHMANPDGLAWQNMRNTGEGANIANGHQYYRGRTGPEAADRWAHDAIWGNVPDQQKARFGSVENVTSRDFTSMWAARVNRGGGGTVTAAQGAPRPSTPGVPFVGSQGQPTVAGTPQISQTAAPFSAQGAQPLDNVALPQTGGTQASQPQQPAAPQNLAEKMKIALDGALNDPDLSEAEKEQTEKHIRQQFQTMDIIENQTAKAKVEAANAAAGDYTTRMYDMLGKPGQDWVSLYNQINHDPALHDHPAVRKGLLDNLMKHSGSDQIMDFGPGFYDLKKRLLSEPGTPGHIGDPLEIYKVDPGVLTLKGQHELSSMMKEVKKSYDGAAVQRAISHLETFAKSRLTFENSEDPFSLKDAPGQRIFHAQFIPQFEAAFQKWVNEGNNPFEFLTEKKVIEMTSALRSKSQMEADQLRAIGESPQSDAEKNLPIPLAPEGIDEKAWGTVMAQPMKTDNGTSMVPSRRGGLVQYLIKNPTPEVMAAIDRRAGLPGFSAKALDTLGVKPVAPATIGEAQPAPTVVPPTAQPSPAVVPTRAPPQPSGGAFHGERISPPSEAEISEQEAEIARRQTEERAKAEQVRTSRFGDRSTQASGPTPATQTLVAKSVKDREARLSAIDREETELRREAASPSVLMGREHKASIERRLKNLTDERASLIEKRHH